MSDKNLYVESSIAGVSALFKCFCSNKILFRKIGMKRHFIMNLNRHIKVQCL